MQELPSNNASNAVGLLIAFHPEIANNTFSNEVYTTVLPRVEQHCHATRSSLEYAMNIAFVEKISEQIICDGYTKISNSN